MIFKRAFTINTFVSILSFILAPFLSMMVGLLRMKNERNLWMLFFFYILFGLCFTINLDQGFDSERYVAKFLLISSDNLKDIYLSNIMIDKKAGDVYFPIVAWITKLIAGKNYHVMFALFALVFALFTINTLKIFYEKACKVKALGYSLMVFLLIINNSIFNINGMRFWSAAWILAYAILSIYVNKSRSGYIWLAVTPFVHLTFIYPIIVFAIAKFVGHFEKPWIILLFISAPFSFLSLELIPSIAQFVPSMYMHKFNFYTDQHYIIERASGTGFKIVQDSLQFCLMMWEIICLYKIYLFRKNKDWKYNLLFRFTIIFIALSNFFSAIPSFGRFVYVGFPLFLFLIWINQDKQFYQKAFMLLPVIMSFTIMYTIFKQIVTVLPSDFYYSNVVFLVSQYI